MVTWRSGGGGCLMFMFCYYSSRQGRDWAATELALNPKARALNTGPRPFAGRSAPWRSATQCGPCQTRRSCPRPKTSVSRPSLSCCGCWRDTGVRRAPTGSIVWERCGKTSWLMRCRSWSGARRSRCSIRTLVQSLTASTWRSSILPTASKIFVHNWPPKIVRR